MPTRMMNLYDGKSLLDLSSYARRGPGHRDTWSPADIEHIARTVNRTPEVMVKVLSKGGQHLSAVQAHLNYIGRNGELHLDTDDGEPLQGKGAAKELLQDWDLDLEEARRRSDLTATDRRAPPKSVHKLMFSMPAGTPPDKVLAAVKSFAREEFALKHRYVMALHTDEPHPHVHMVVKAMSEQGVRLNIKKATLRYWRAEFARYLRERGIAANATERAVRGESQTPKKDGIYRALRRGESTHMRERTNQVATELANGSLRIESGKSKLIYTRGTVLQGWHAVAGSLHANGVHQLAGEVHRFADRLPPPLTEKEQLAMKLRIHLRERTAVIQR